MTSLNQACGSEITLQHYSKQSSLFQRATKSLLFSLYAVKSITTQVVLCTLANANHNS